MKTGTEAHNSSPEDLTASIRAVEANMRKLLNSGLTESAVVLLLAHDSKLAPETVRKVLKAATSLTKWAVKS